MAYDAFVLAACLQELREHAVSAKINKIHQPGKNSLILRYHGRNGSGKLLLCSGAEEARIHLSSASPENPAKAPLFLMVARKWLEGAVLKQVRQTPYERVAELIFLTRNEVGDAVTVRLIIEIMGKHSNIILADEAGSIIDGIRRYDSRLSRYREVMPHCPYLPPPPQNKTTPPFADEEALAKALLDENWQETLPQALNRRVTGISPWLARELLARAGLKETLLMEQLGLHELNRLLPVLNSLCLRLQNGDFQPTLLYEAGRPVDFAALAPALWQGREQRSCASMSEALDIFYAEQTQTRELAREKRHMAKPLQQHVARLQRKISLQNADLAASERGESYKTAADLLSAHQYLLLEQAPGGRGLTEISLPCFDDPATQIRIELDAALNTQQNIQSYYRRYNKCRKARVAIEQHLQAAEQELEYLQSVSASLQTAELMAELGEIEKELKAAGIISAPPPAKGGKKGAQADKEAGQPLPPRRFISADGFTILVGRNNRQNERLSLKTAAADDIWLHTQKIPGSHVIIVCEGKEVPQSTLAEAAAYAAWYSQARESGKVPVDYTRAAQVKKPVNAKPGMVIYFQQQTIYVQPRQPAGAN